MIYQYKCCMWVACMQTQNAFIFAAMELSQPSDADETGLGGSRGNTATGVHTAKSATKDRMQFLGASCNIAGNYRTNVGTRVHFFTSLFFEKQWVL